MIAMTGRPARLVLAVAMAAVLAARAALAVFPATDPNDPNYPPDVCPPATTCGGPTGQWNLFSFAPNLPPTTHESGISADLAWMVTTGRSDVVIAVLDSGVEYDHEDLRYKIWLNRGEMPVPLGTCSPPIGDPHDCNADGVFNMLDYATDPGIVDANGSGVIDRGDLRGNALFVNGIDDDGNGYVDDLSGFDTDDDDGDEFDHRFFGHGTGRAGIAGPETDNGLGVAGVCPDCPLMNLRIDDTFVVSSEGAAKGAIYAVDNGAKVINMALGGQTASTLSRGAFDYATTKDVLAVNASANEFSFHHNFQTIFDDVMAIGGVTPDNRNLTTTWLRKANFSNFGAHLDVVAPTVMPSASMGLTGSLPNHANYSETASGTSSAVPHAAGVAALVFSRGLDLALSPPLSTQEVRQIINRTARDVTPTDDPSGYAVSVGWDKYTGYGRIDARDAVDLVAAGTIPPEADVNAPDWYTLNDGVVTVEYYANARRATTFDYTLEVGTGVEPASFTTLASAVGVAANPALSSADRVSNLSTPWDTGPLADGFYTLRLRVTDDLGNEGEDRMGVWVRHPDSDDQPGFPRQFEASLESISIALVDLDDDNALEIVFSDSDGNVRAVRADGTDLPGFPVQTDPPKNLPLVTSDAFDGNPANGEVPVTGASIVGGPAVADLDRDGVQEIVVGASDGQAYCWHADGSVCAGFPVSTDPGLSRDPYGAHAQVPNTSRGEYIIATPALGDLDGDQDLEIVVGSVDQKLYVWHHDGTRLAPFPIEVFDPGSASGVDAFAPAAIVSSAAVADVDDDGDNEIVIGTNEVYSTPNLGGTGGSGRAYLIEANGTIAPGWPVQPVSLSPGAVPVVAEGIGSSPALADLDGNGQLEAAVSVFFGDPVIFNADGSTFATMQGPFGATGPGSDDDEATAEGGLAKPIQSPSRFYVSQGIFADLDGLAPLEYAAGTVGNGLAFSAIFGEGGLVPVEHLVSAWTSISGTSLPVFPRVIEDWQFVTGPVVAEIDGDGLNEIIATSGGYWVHAWNTAGLEPAGWPKLTGQWQTAVPSVGDLDGDGDVEVVVTSRLGNLFVWSTGGPTCQTDEWRKFRHDEWNSGTYGADTLRPAGIDDLAFSTAGSDAQLDFTAVGDDGRCGTATTYDLRASSTPISLANFGAATPLALAAPALAGTAESRVLTPPTGALFFALRAVDEVGNFGPLASVGGFELRRLRAVLRGAGQDRFVLRGNVLGAVADLGLPGQDITLTLSNAGGTFFSATVPAAELVQNAAGTKVRFRDASGTVAGGINRLVIGGRRRNRLIVRTRRVTLTGAAAGPFTVTLDVGPVQLTTDGTFRAAGPRLLFP